MCSRYESELIQALKGEIDARNAIKICQTPPLLIEAGCEDLPILFTQKHLRNCLHEKGKNPHWHGLSLDLLLQVPELLEKPAMIYDSLTQEDSIVVVLEAVDADKLPIIAALRLNGEGQYEFEKIDVNFMVSIYGHENLCSVIQKAYTADFLIFVDKEKSQELSNMSQLPLLQGLDNLDFNVIIHKTNSIVNE